MNDHLEGLIDGVGMAICLVEKNRKNPKRIESLLASLIRDMAMVAGNHQLDKMNNEAGWARDQGTPYPKK